MISVVHLPPGDQWDQNLLDRLLLGELYPHGIDCEFVEPWPDTAGIVLVIPGRYWHDRTDEITTAIARYEWVLAIRTGDEEALLDIAEIEHPNLRWWVQTPRGPRDFPATRYLPLGFPPHFNKLGAMPPAKALDVFLAAQDTHARRSEAFEALAAVDRTKLVEPTSGFTRGLPPIDYTAVMVDTKVAPCPSGAVSPDSFRVYEALEAHVVPIADDVSPVYPSNGYWMALFPDAPFPTLTNYSDLPGYIDDVLTDYPRLANRTAAWWMRQKRRMAGWLQSDVAALGAIIEPVEQPITVLVTCSPIPSHPSTEILQETIDSIRAQLPDAEIVLTFDGVRPEQQHRRGDYELFIQRALWLADHQWGNVLPLIHDEHLHQAVCAKRALDHVQSPLLLFVEHDTPLVGEIPWNDIADTILAGDANVVRLHHEASILEPHRYLMLDQEPQKVRGVPMSRTVQWSQRPHLASVAWYRDLLDRYFPTDERDFIEDRVYGRLVAAHKRDGEMGWLGWRTWIYTPDGDIKRSYHTDGRAGEDKFDA